MSSASVSSLNSGPGPSALAGTTLAKPSNTRPDRRNPVPLNRPPNMRVSRFISLVIGRATDRKVQRVLGPRRGSGVWTRRVPFDMKRRTGSREPAVRRDSPPSPPRKSSNVNNIRQSPEGIDGLAGWRPVAHSGRLLMAGMDQPSPWWSATRHADRKPFLMARREIGRGVRGWVGGQGFFGDGTRNFQSLPGNVNPLPA